MDTTPDIPARLIPTGEATAILPVDSVGPGPRRSGGKPITVIANAAIRQTLDTPCLKQAINSRLAPGVTDVIINPDAHLGYGAPVGCVLVSPTHIYPGPVGVDIKCSMSLLQLDVPSADLRDKKLRRALIDAIVQRTPTGAGRGGTRHAPKARRVDATMGLRVVTEGASEGVLRDLGVPVEWSNRCEDSSHTGHDGTSVSLRDRVDGLLAADPAKERLFADKMAQLGSYGGGNHFGECEDVRIVDSDRARAAAATFGLLDGRAAFLSHCGSRGWGAMLADRQFKTLQRKFEEWDIPLPGNDRQLVYAPLGTAEADAYLDDMALGANFATVNHLLINALVLEAFQEVLPGVRGELVYFISHNIARREIVNNQPTWVHRKGATRAFPAGHHALKDTPFSATGHPILLPGNPQAGSAVMVAEPGAELSCYSVNHGAGRRMSRSAAAKTLDQKRVDESFERCDILSNCRNYPIDEAPKAYKDFEDVLASVKTAGLASEVARLHARFVIKDGDKADD